MAMGKRKSEQPPLWVPTTELPVSPGHPFYARLSAILDEASRWRKAGLRGAWDYPQQPTATLPISGSEGGGRGRSTFFTAPQPPTTRMEQDGISLSACIRHNPEGPARGFSPR